MNSTERHLSEKNTPSSLGLELIAPETNDPAVDMEMTLDLDFLPASKY